MATIDAELHQQHADDLFARLASCFPRRESRQVFCQMAEGMLMELEDYNCWSLAEAVGHRGPHRLQHLLSRAAWDEQAVLDAAAAFAIEQLGDAEAVLIADETGDEKSSTDAVGAARQYCGALGGIGLCQVAVHLAYATTTGHTIIDRRLYLPTEWAADDERRELTGVPEELALATKPQLAEEMLRRAVGSGVPCGFFLGDEVYGTRALRRCCRELNVGYVLAVRADHRITTGLGPMTATTALGRLPHRAWQRMRTGTGSKSARDYDWAMIGTAADDLPAGGSDDGVSVLLIRRHRYTRTLPFFRCWSPQPVSLARLVALVWRRWHEEEDFQAAKDAAHLDAGQVTGWTSWHRWSTAALVALTLLTVGTALELRRDNAPGTPGEAELVPRWSRCGRPR